MQRVLIIESESDQQSLATILRRAGYDVVETGGTEGWPGLYYLREETFQLVVINEELLAMEGVELLPSLRHITDAPVVIIGSGGEDSVVYALIQGADAYLPVSASGEAVTAYIKALLRRHRPLALAG